MLSFLFFFSFSLTIVLFVLKGNDDFPLRTGLLKTSIIYGLLIVAVTEGFTLVQALNFSSLVTFWSLLLTVNFILVISYLKKTGKWNLSHENRVDGTSMESASSERTSYNLQYIIRTISNSIAALNLVQKVALYGTVIVLGICLITALIAPPNNFDSMTYHMARIMHWVQNQGVRHYPTHNLRQLFMPPGASYIVLHLQVLSDGDRFANSVQWFAFLGSITAASLISQAVKSPQSQIITALVCASIPMAIMQSTTTQNDLMTAFWLITSTYFTLRSETYKVSDYFWITAALGLAILTKPTGIIFGWPLVLIMMGRSLRFTMKSTGLSLKQVSRILISGILVFLIALSLSLPHFSRNYVAFDNFLMPDEPGLETRNTSLGLLELTSNFLRLVALNMPFPQFWQFVEAVHQNVLHIESTAASTSFDQGFPGYIPAAPALLIPDEDNVGNPIHLCLLLVALGALFYGFACVKNRFHPTKIILLDLSSTVVLGFLSYCLLIKWQVWANRLILPTFILGSPLIGYFIHNNLSKSMQKLLAVLLAMTAIFYSLTPVHHPLIALPNSWRIPYQSESILRLKREDIYFSAHAKSLKPVHIVFANNLKQDQCHTVGLDINVNDWEYPFWIFFKSQGISPLQMKHVNVQNESRKLEPEFPDADLCAVLQQKGGIARYFQIKKEPSSSTF